MPAPTPSSSLFAARPAAIAFVSYQGSPETLGHHVLDQAGMALGYGHEPLMCGPPVEGVPAAIGNGLGFVENDSVGTEVGVADTAWRAPWAPVRVQKTLWSSAQHTTSPAERSSTSSMSARARSSPIAHMSERLLGTLKVRSYPATGAFSPVVGSRPSGSPAYGSASNTSIR